jgi:uncharacterized protein
MKRGDVLIIFTKNPVYGSVKTRLAATIGKDNAFEVHKALLVHTHSVAEQLLCDKIVFYSEYIETNDIWGNGYLKANQQGCDLGERMMNSFNDVFKQGYTKAVIIGTDCPSINEKLINDAFGQLNNNDIVVGPAWDGGYYLLGMKILHQDLFENMVWSTEAVFKSTIAKCDQLGLNYVLLPVLHDIDEEKDLVHLKSIQH